MSTMNHAKIMLIDGQEGVIGSQNMDILSFNWNIEVGVFFRQKDLVGDLDHIVSHWKKEAVPFAAHGRQIKFTDRILIAILKIFYPIF
jgi:phosphatidylserine/phosphatidylglycerophosphate/cardiolipin synthase-like enzyme